MIPIKDETRLIDLTIGELKSVLSNIIRDTMSGYDVGKSSVSCPLKPSDSAPLC